MRTYTKPPCNSRVRARRCTFAAALAALTLGAVSARSQVITFEQGTIPGTTSAEGIPISNQYQTSLGVSFSLHDRTTGALTGFPKLAEVGAPQTAFQGVANAGAVPPYGTEDGVAAGDFGLTGRFFLTDDGVVAGVPDNLLISYTVATSEASGVILDIDGNEKWTIEALDASDAILATVVLTTTTPHTGDGLATPWAFNRGTADIKSIRIRFTGTASGGVGLAFDRFSPSAGSGPTVNTDFATGVGLTGATLNGTINPNGTTTNAHFEWGTTTSYGTSTSTQNVGNGINDTSVNASLAGLLQPHTTYHFRLFATNSNGSNDGGDQSFTTGNSTPSANGQSQSTNEDINLPLTLTGSDGDGDSLTFNITDNPDHGVLIPGGGGSFTYDPDPNYFGSDSFQFTVSDGFGGTSSAATVNINVISQNDAPVLTVPEGVTVNEDSGANNVPGLSVSDADVTDIVTVNYTQGSKGSVSGTFPNLTYTPNLNATGSDSFQLTANDGHGGTDVEIVSIQITPSNDAPVLTVPELVTVNEDSGANNISGLSVSDPDFDSVTVNYTQGSKGTVSGTFPNLTYTPNLNANGSDSFQLTANDGHGGTDVEIVSIQITPVNDAPVLTVPEGVTVNEDSGANNIPGLSVSDVDLDTVTVNYTQGSKGSVSGTFPNLTYTPNLNANGSDSIQLTANDGHGGTDVETVSIQITPVNDAPVLTAPESVTVNEDSGANNISGLSVSDVDLDSVTVNYTQGSKGTVAGTFPNLTYTPNLNANGSDSFQLTANDGHGGTDVETVSIQIAPVNDAPVLTVPGLVTVNEDSGSNIVPGLSVSDVDLDEVSVNYTQGSKGSVAGTFPNLTYTPNSNATGSDSFDVTANDGHGGTDVETVSIQITSVNDAPVLTVPGLVTVNEDSGANNIPGLSVSDADLDEVSVNYTQGAKGTVAGTFPNLTYTPNSNATGSDSFQVTANDGHGGTDVEIVSIQINSSNDSPVLTVPGLVTINEDSGSNSIAGLSVSDPDLGDTVTVNYTQGAKGTVVGTFPNLTYTPNSNATGSDSFQLTANDGNGGTDVKNVSIQIDPVNDAPVANGQSLLANSGQGLPITLTGSDVDGPTANYSIVDGPSHGGLSGTAPNVTYTSTPGYNGPDSFTFKINDGSTDSNVATVDITVSTVGNAPNAVDDYAFCGGSPVLIDVLDNDTDPDNDPLSILSFTQPASGTVTLVSGQLQFAPVGTLGSVQTFTYTITDGSNVDTATVSVYPLPAAGSSYAGLITDGSDETRGILIFRVNKGAYGTGAMIIDGRRYPFRGSLLANRNILAGRGVTSLQLRISIGPPVGGNLSLHYNVPSLSFSGDAEQSPYSRTNPAPQLGRYTIHLERQVGGTGPRTGGALQGTVINIGRVRLAGKQGNGNSVSCGSFILTGNRVPLYFASVPGVNVQTLSGNLQIGTGAAPQISQSLRYRVPAGTDVRLSAGVDEDYDATGARYVSTRFPRAMLALNGANQADLTLTGPTIGSPASILKVLGNSIYLYGGMPVPYMTFAPGAGLFSGKYYPPATPDNPVYFFGVMIQGTGLNFGRGSVVEDAGIGAVDLVPRP